MAEERAAREERTERRAPRGNRNRRGRRRVCSFCVDKVDYIDYKDVNRLKKYITEKGKIFFKYPIVPSLLPWKIEFFFFSLSCSFLTFLLQIFRIAFDIQTICTILKLFVNKL